MKRLILFGLLGGLLASNSGCGLLQAIFCYRPCISRGDCPPGMVGDPCDDGCGAVCGGPVQTVRGPRRAVVYDDCDPCCDVVGGRPCRQAGCRRCGPCVDPCADPCGDCCYGRCWHRGPLSCVFALFMHGCWWGGNCAGCGERYWGDFYSDPPDCWDPCPESYGYRAGGCRSCNQGYSDYGYSRNVGSMGAAEEIPAPRENIISQTDQAVSPAPKPHKAARP